MSVPKPKPSNINWEALDLVQVSFHDGIFHQDVIRLCICPWGDVFVLLGPGLPPPSVIGTSFHLCLPPLAMYMGTEAVGSGPLSVWVQVGDRRWASFLYPASPFYVASLQVLPHPGVSSLVIRCGISHSLLIGGKIRNFVNDLLFLKA